MKNSQRRLVELDCLRGIASLAVVIEHLTLNYNKHYAKLETPLLNLHLARYGVFLFFMISGFVIFMTLSKTAKPMDFIVSRFSRLYPTYWTSIIITSILLYLMPLPNYDLNLKLVIMNFTMIQEFIGFRHIDWSYWTLQIEIFFYFIMLVIYMTNQLKRIELILFLWLALRLTYIISETLFSRELSWTANQILILEYIPFFSIGILFYLIHSRSYTNIYLMGLCFFIALTNIYLANTNDLESTIMFMIIFFALSQNKLGFITFKPIVFLGSISYPLYLIHQYAGFSIMNKLASLGIAPAPQFIFALLFSIFTATFISRTIEIPMMRLIRDYYKSNHQISKQPSPQ